MGKLASTSRWCVIFPLCTRFHAEHPHPALTFVLAPLPNALFSRCGGDDFSAEYEGSGRVDMGRFITATIVVTGFALPLVLAHSEVIRPGACAMSIVGGAYVFIVNILLIVLT